MDRKMAAAGDEQETLPRNDRSSAMNPTPEYCLSIIEYLEAFTGKQLAEKEREMWLSRMMRYPLWRLDRLGQYTGTLTNEVFRFLEAQQQDIPVYKALPAPDPTKREREGMIRVLKYCREVGEAKDHEARVKLEQEFAKDMLKKFKFHYKPILGGTI